MAPEPGLEAALRALPGLQLTAADLDPSAGHLRADLQSLPFGDQQFDVVIANHVLEHVHDDLAAFREVHRVLKPGGFAVLQVPVNGPSTRDDPAATPEERLRLHGQRDHVRTYGRDVADRVMAATPLTAAWVDVRDLVSLADRHRFALTYAPDFGVDLNALREAWEIHRYDRADGATRA